MDEIRVGAIQMQITSNKEENLAKAERFSAIWSTVRVPAG